ncbi:Copper transport outer membrane protein, MctB [Georgenia satyanarayanai]|uniref:Copper transport outer membrane protein, MctB n=1 Tax=Georgenia satyanarayanai TaxID=860221 RepID=A0A2Y9AG14_9MICO|nr:copper transporter [Georgenia satyanarayanai]PYF99132.1 copper transport outer membrane protein MctB [Georgenia satyanarayanai]SSA43250.1 Copper transport outer membrane protein, MctB [Georgenia satyanarayanai]
MIDFRYHLVSLIAVFLALALGILLGAGPLNQPLGDQLTGQVEELREDRDRLRTELEVSEAERETRDQFLDEVAPATLGSRLEGRSVAVVVLPAANEDDVADVRLRLEQAGATVTGQVQVTEAWTDPGTATFRSSFAGQILGYLDPAPQDGADAGVILGTALGQALTRGDVDGTLTTDAETLLELLVSAEDPLVELTEEPGQAANATVVVAPRSEATGPEETPEPADVETREQRLAEEVALARGVAATGEGTVVVGSAATELDLISAVRADADAAQAVTTTDSIAELTGRLSVPMALAVDISGEVGHYGVGAEATALVPPAVYLPPPAVPGPEQEEAAETEDAG